MQDFLKFMPRMEELNQQAQDRAMSSSDEPQRGLAKKRKSFASHILNEDSSNSNTDSAFVNTQQHILQKRLRQSRMLSTSSADKTISRPVTKRDSFFGGNQAVFETGRTVFFPRVDSSSSITSKVMMNKQEGGKLNFGRQSNMPTSSDTDYGSKRVKFDRNLAEQNHIQTVESVRIRDQIASRLHSAFSHGLSKTRLMSRGIQQQT